MVTHDLMKRQIDLLERIAENKQIEPDFHENFHETNAKRGGNKHDLVATKEARMKAIRSYLETHPGAKASDIAKHTGIPQNTVYRLLKAI